MSCPDLSKPLQKDHVLGVTQDTVAVARDHDAAEFILEGGFDERGIGLALSKRGLSSERRVP